MAVTNFGVTMWDNPKTPLITINLPNQAWQKEDDAWEGD